MCAGDPNAGAREQARIRHQEKNAAFEDQRVAYHNEEYSYLTSNQRAVMGLSRTYGDIMEAGIRQRGVLRGASENIVRRYAVSKDRAKAAEGGRSRTAGKNRYLELLNRQTIIENQIRNTVGANAFKQYLGANRQYRAVLAGNREKLGLPPTYGSPVMMPPKGNTMLANLGMAATVAGAVITGGASMGATMGFASTKAATAVGAGLSAGGSVFTQSAYGGY